MALRGYLASVKAQSSSVSFTDEATSTSDNQNYTITDTAKAIWDIDSSIVVEDGGVPTSEAYTLSRLTGKVTFETVDAGRVITVTGDYVALATVAEAKKFSFSGSCDALDATRFLDEYRQYEAGNVTATAEIGEWLSADDYFIEMLINGDINVIEFYPNYLGDPIRFYALANTRNVESPQSGLLDETISFNITTEIGV